MPEPSLTGLERDDQVEQAMREGTRKPGGRLTSRRATVHATISSDLLDNPPPGSPRACAGAVCAGGGGGVRLSTKGDYGVRALIELALHEGEGPVQRAVIAARRQIPESYLDHLLAQLRRDGFVRSTRGPSGGHELARPASEIRLLDVLESLEGSLAPLGCLEDGEAHSEQHVVCGQRWVWQEIYDAMRVRLAAVTLAELLERDRTRKGRIAPSYSI